MQCHKVLYVEASLSLSLSPSLCTYVSVCLLVCGDGQCSGDIGETCETCARDCCIPVAVGITLGVIVFISAFIVSSIIVAVSAVSYFSFCLVLLHCSCN